MVNSTVWPFFCLVMVLPRSGGGCSPPENPWCRRAPQAGGVDGEVIGVPMSPLGGTVSVVVGGAAPFPPLPDKLQRLVLGQVMGLLDAGHPVCQVPPDEQRDQPGKLPADHSIPEHRPKTTKESPLAAFSRRKRNCMPASPASAELLEAPDTPGKVGMPGAPLHYFRSVSGSSSRWAAQLGNEIFVVQRQGEPLRQSLRDLMTAAAPPVGPGK